MFHSRKLNNWINQTHERALRLVWKDYTSTFGELQLRDNSFRIHHRNLQKLAIEIFKVKLGLASEIMKNVFPIIENPYDLEKEAKFWSRNVHTVRYGIKIASFVRCTKNLEQHSKKLQRMKVCYGIPSNRLYVEQITCHLLMLLLSAGACSKTVSYGNQSIYLHCKSIDWFLYDAGFCWEVCFVKCRDFA